MRIPRALLASLLMPARMTLIADVREAVQRLHAEVERSRETRQRYRHRERLGRVAASRRLRRPGVARLKARYRRAAAGWG